MRALGLDPSLTSYGWCVYDTDAGTRPERLVRSGHEGTVNTSVPTARFVHFRALVKDLLRRFRVDVVGVESPAFDAGPFQTVHFGLMHFSLEAAFDARKDCVLFDPATVKLVSTGDSGASKAEMQKAVQIDRMTTSLVQSDESDAYLIARAAARFTMLRRGLLSPEELDAHEERVFLSRSKKAKGKVKKTAHLFRENSRFFQFSRVPEGDVALPKREDIRPELLEWLERDVSSKVT